MCDHYARTVLVEPYFAVGPWLDGQRYLHRASTEFILIDRWQPDHLIALSPRWCNSARATFPAISACDKTAVSSL
ncbi:hypothetical protein L833_4015 [Mycobacteroides abscessus MAB_091912_2446]|uniref:Uncharacterized protein n=1 Tax=Mycobacteroides abscessus MAB_091912_2446 TaxID=1335414 RepID=A0A829M0C8_9MYCO|nr:hypothetical protein L833_4015 [Mycobacteroides abscessus MAB_091912_2446]